jgi:serine/threonine protein phosphatase 1
LICIGDVVDGWPETKQSIDEFLKIKNLILIRGNHDEWFLNYAKTGDKPEIWTSQGGYNTLLSYEQEDVPKEHTTLLENAKLWHIENNILFVHGGIIAGTHVEDNSKDEILWNRSLIHNARIKGNMRPDYRMQNIYSEIFIGHTTTGHFGTYEPVKFCEITDIDTGGGWEGKLTIMNLKTREYFQSDYVKDLYPKSRARADCKDILLRLYNGSSRLF